MLKTKLSTIDENDKGNRPENRVQSDNAVKTTKTTLSEECRTYNWRFGATAALTPRKKLWENERL